MTLLVTLRQRRDLCRALHELSGRQRETLAAGDYDGLIAILEERKTLLARLGELATSAVGWSMTRVHASEPERSEGDVLWDETRSLLAALAKSEHEAIGELTARRDATRNELRELTSAGRVNAAYRDSLAPVTHRALDVDR